MAPLHRSLLTFLLAGALAGCSGQGRIDGDDDDDDDIADDDDTIDDDDTTEAPPEAVGVTCSPAVESLTFDYGFPQLVQLTAEVQWNDGASTSESMTWQILDGFGGSVTSAGLYTTPSDHGGVARIEARYETLAEVCEFEVTMEAELTDSADPSILDASNAVLTTSDDSCAPSQQYPLDGSLMPDTLPRPSFYWGNPAGSNAFMVRLSASYATVDFVTTSTSWRPDNALWLGLVFSAVQEPVDVEIFGGNWDAGSGTFSGPLCGPSEPDTLTVADEGSTGTIYYWSPITSGLWRLEAGADVPESWLNPENTGGYCVGCHSVNLANPAMMAMTWGGGNGDGVAVEIATPTTPVVGPGNGGGNFMALNPTGTRMVRTFHGVLYLHDLVNNVELGTLPSSQHATHPNWSPDGNSIVYSSCAYATDTNDWNAYECSLKIIPVLPDDAFGAETTLVPYDGNSYYYGSFSPDSQWVVFNRAPGISNNNPNSVVMIVFVDGGTPILLDAASGVPGLTNSWPTWAPGQGQYGWIAWSSRRSYGPDLAAGNAQLWITGIDWDRATLGADPSYPPVWLPGQALDTGNHTPIWAARETSR